MGTVLNINTDASVVYASKLEKMHRSAFPNAVRATLNKAAFDVKQNTMPGVAGKVFVKRQANFFKANSKVAPATGFNIQGMKATVGFKPLSGTNKAVDDLQQQEHGGAIGGRSFVALKQARVSGSYNKNVRANARISDIKKKVTDSRRASGRSNREKFIKSAVHAKKDGYVIGNKTNAAGNKILFRIRSIVRKKGNTIIKTVPLYSVKKNRKVSPVATGFMRTASLQSVDKMPAIFKQEALKQLNRMR